MRFVERDHIFRGLCAGKYMSAESTESQSVLQRDA